MRYPLRPMAALPTPGCLARLLVKGWLNLMATGFSVILTAVSLFSSTAWRIAFLLLAVAAIFIAAYRTWAEERTSVIKLQKLWQDPVEIALSTLPTDSLELLMEASKDPNGQIWRTQDNRGLHIATNRREFVSQPVAKEEARWDGALGELIGAKAAQQASTETCFHVTRLGFQIAGRAAKVAAE